MLCSRIRYLILKLHLKLAENMLSTLKLTFLVLHSEAVALVTVSFQIMVPAFSLS